MPFFGHKVPMRLAKEFGIKDVHIPGGDSDELADYFLFLGTKIAYKCGILDLWIMPHCFSHMKCRFMTNGGPEFIRSTIKRLEVMRDDDRTSPHMKNWLVFGPSFWYTPIQPEHPTKAIPLMMNTLPGIAGNIKFAMEEGGTNSALAMCGLSVGDMNLHNMCCDTFRDIRCDTEALDMDKATIDCYRFQHVAQKAFYKNEAAGVHAAWVKVQGLPSKYPKVPKGALPTPVSFFMFVNWLTSLALDENDFVTATNTFKKVLNP
jgi:hypothetical protein